MATSNASVPRPSSGAFAARLFGWDVFVSFALGPPPRGSRTYASDLARKLRERDFTVFFSEEEAPPGDTLDSTLKRALTRARLLVVIANRGTVADPRWVRTEVEEFRRCHPERPVIAINVGGALDDPALADQAHAWLPFRDRIWVNEAEEALAAGAASDDVVARLATAPRGMRAGRRLRASVATAFALLAATAAAAVGFGITAQRHAELATSGRLAAESQLAAQRDPGLSALLAVAAWRERETSAARAALLQAVGRHPHLATEVRRFADAVGRDDAVRALAFSPDGRELAVGTASGLVAFVSMAARRVTERPLVAHAEPVTRLVYSPDGTRLASVGREPDIRLWDVRRRVPLGDLASNDPAWDIAAVAFSPDGQRLASAGADLLIWDLSTMARVSTLHNDTQFAYSDLVWSRDGRLRAITTAGLLDTWDPVTSERVAQDDLGDNAASAPHITESADGRYRMIDGTDKGPGTGPLLLWDLRDPAAPPRKMTGHDGSVAAFAFASDGNRAASAGYDGTVRIWRTGSIEPAVASPFTAHRGIVRSLAWVPGQGRLVTGGDDGRVFLWDVDAPPPMTRWLKTRGAEVTSLAFMPDGKRLLVPGEGEVEIWDVGSGQRVGSVETGFKAGITSVAASPSGALVAAATGYGEANEAAIWAVASGGGATARARISLGRRNSHALAFAGEDALLVQDAEAIVRHRIADGRPEAQIDARTVALAPWPARRALLFSEGRQIRAVDERLLPAAGLVGPSAPANTAFAIAPHPSDAMAATLHQGLTDAVRLWDLGTGGEIQPQFRGALNEYEFSRIAFTPDGRTLVGVGRGMTLFDFETRRVMGVLPGGHARGLKSFAMSPIAPLAASGSFDGGILLWDLDPDRWAAYACQVANRNPSCPEWRQFFGMQKYSAICPGLQAPTACQ